MNSNIQGQRERHKDEINEEISLNEEDDTN